MSTEQKIERYLNAMHYALSPLSISEKAEIITEIKSHIEESLEQEQDIDTVLDNLGDPDNVATRYLQEKGLEQTRKVKKNIFLTLTKWFLYSVLLITFLLALLIGFAIWKFVPMIKQATNETSFSISDQMLHKIATSGNLHIDDNGISYTTHTSSHNSEHKEDGKDGTFLNVVINDDADGDSSINISTNTNSTSFKSSSSSNIGDASLFNKTIDSFQSFGDLKVKNSTITNSLKAFGGVDVESSNINDLRVLGDAYIVNTTIKGRTKVHGSLIIEDTVIKGKTKIFGSLEAKNSKIEENISVYSKECKFTNTVLKGISVKENQDGAQQKIILNRGSVINGDIKFNKNGGLVEVDSSVVINGDVKGGVIITKE